MIYFIQQGLFGPIKIGYSTNPLERLRNLQTSHHAALRILGTIDGGQNDERRLHEKFSAHRIRREWFAPSQDVVDYIRNVLGKNPFADAFDGDAIEQETQARVQVGRPQPPKAISDLEIIPPGADTCTWIVRSRAADLAVFETTLEDAIAGFINDHSLGHRFGWDATRFPSPKNGAE